MSRKALYILTFLALLIPALPPVFFPFFQPYSFGKTVLFEIIAELMVVVWLFSPQKKFTLFPYEYKIIGALILAFTASTTLTFDSGASFFGSSARMDGLFTFMHFIAFFFILATTLSSYIWKRCMYFCVGAGTFVALYGILQWFAVSFIVESRGEIFSTLGNPSYLVLYLLCTLGITLYLAQSKQKRELSLLLYCAGVIQGIVILLTQVQAGLFALIVGALFFLFPFIRTRITMRYGAIACILVGVIILLFSFSASFSKLTSFSEGNASLKNRSALWRITLSGILEKPILGHGTNAFEKFYLEQKNNKTFPIPDTGETFDKPHNAYLEMLFSYGILGFLAYISFLWILLRRTWKFLALRAALISYLVFLFFFFDTFASLVMLFFISAFLFSSHAPQEIDTATDKIKIPFFRLKVVFGGIVFIIIFFAFHFGPLYSAYYANQFLTRAYRMHTIDGSIKEKALRYRSFNTPFIERAVFVVQRSLP